MSYSRPTGLLLSLLVAGCSGGDLVVFETLEAAPGGGNGGMPQATVGAASGADGGGGQSASFTAATSGTNTSTMSTGGTVPDPPGDCAATSDCSTSWFCSKQSCEMLAGSCHPRPVLCAPEPEPVCGCDGVTYWNDCLRQQYGVVSSSPGECQAGAVRCRSAADCGLPGTHCTHLLFLGQSCPQAGSPPELGACWAVPLECSDEKNPDRWYLCPPPDAPAGAGAICGNTCQAIRSELPHLRGEPVCSSR